MKRILKRIVVTGATSTIGVAVIYQALENNLEVLAICRRGCHRKDRLPDNQAVKIIECDISEYKDLEINDLGNYDAFFHLAWLSSINDKERNNLYAQANNIMFALDSVELAYRLGCKVYIGGGSQAEYGRTTGIIKEETQTRPETAYGMAKLCSGQMTKLACHKKGIAHIWPRIFSVYGPCCADTTVIQYTIKTLLDHHVPMLSSGQQIWDFLYLKDVGRALLTLAESGKDGEIYCVASGQSKMLKEYLEIVRGLIDPNVKLGFGMVPYNENSVMSLKADITKIRSDINFMPQYAFEDGIKETIEWNIKNRRQKNDIS